MRKQIKLSEINKWPLFPIQKVFEARTKFELIVKIINSNPHVFYTVSNYGTGYKYKTGEGDFFIVYNLNKRCKKLISQKTVTKIYNGKVVKSNKRTYSPSNWTAYVYYIPQFFLYLNDIEVHQTDRSFHFIKKSNYLKSKGFM